MAAWIRDRSGIDRAALSGGCFQNRILLEGCVEGLEGAGFTVYTHQRVPANDGGIALGQAVVAGYRVMSTER
jgi:hydrogenase maturation protein HypF